MGVVKETAGTKQNATSSGPLKQSSSTTPEDVSPQAGGSPSGDPEQQVEGLTGKPARIIPLHTLPASMTARLLEDLFEDPLLTLESVGELRDKMKWSFQFMQVCFNLVEYFLSVIASASNTKLVIVFPDCCQLVFF